MYFPIETNSHWISKTRLLHRSKLFQIYRRSAHAKAWNGSEKDDLSRRDTRAKNDINIKDLGITGIRTKNAVTGARMLLVPGATSGPMADVLAEKLRESFGEEMRVTRPIKRVNLQISGLDGSVTAD